MLIDVIFIDERDLGEAEEQILGNGFNQLFRLISDFQAFQPLQMRRTPSSKNIRHLRCIVRKFSMPQDRRLDGGRLDLWRAIARTLTRPEQFAANRWQDVPIGFERVDIADRNAAFQMRLDILKVFGFGAVDIARNIEVEVVLRDLRERHHARIFVDLGLLRKSIDDLMDILGTQAVLIAVLHKALRGIDHEDAGTRVGVLFVEHDDASGNAGAVKQVWRQADDALNKALGDDPLPDLGLDKARESRQVRCNSWQISFWISARMATEQRSKCTRSGARGRIARPRSVSSNSRKSTWAMGL